jgi:hypothetical protein
MVGQSAIGGPVRGTMHGQRETIAWQVPAIAGSDPFGEYV